MELWSMPAGALHDTVLAALLLHTGGHQASRGSVQATAGDLRRTHVGIARRLANRTAYTVDPTADNAAAFRSMSLWLWLQLAIYPGDVVDDVIVT